MANPQKEDGFTPIANEIAEALCRVNLSAYESRVLWFLFRKTYGWEKKTDRIALSQFSKGTGLDRRIVHRTLKHLEARKIVVIYRGDKRRVRYGFQKNYELWRVSSRRMTGREMSSIEVTTLSSIQSHTRETKQEKKRTPAEILSQISALKERYPSQELIDQAFEAIRLTRKKGRLAPSIILDQLQSWERFPPEQVEVGIRTYLEKGYSEKGKREKYLLGIIRNQKTEAVPQNESTGSALLDRYYREAGGGISA